MSNGRKKQHTTPPREDEHRAERRGKCPDGATEPLDRLAARLGVNLGTGLSPREATRRGDRRGEGLYRTDTRKLSACIKRSLAEPVLWVLLAVAVMALFFDRVGMGVSIVGLAVLRCGLCALCLWLSEEHDAAMQRADAPLCRVLRNRRYFRLPADEVVVGDVICLCPGDLIPADARLIESNGLTVSERPLDARAGGASVSVTLEKNARAPLVEADDRLSPPHMLFGGAVVLTGTARALVVATGKETHLGARTGGITPAHVVRTPVFFTSARHALTIYNYLLAFLILPITVIGILMLGRRFDLLDLFLTSLSLAVLTLGQHLYCLVAYLGARTRLRASANRDRDNRADIKTTADLEKLASMTDLILLGTAALHDGLPHIEQICIGDRVYSPSRNAPDGAVRKLSEWIWLYSGALVLVSERDATAAQLIKINECDEITRFLLAWTQPDTEALSLRVTDVAIVPDSADTTDIWALITYADGETIRLLITDRAESAEAAHSYPAGAQTNAFPPDSMLSEYLCRARLRAIRTGYRVRYVLSERRTTDGKGWERYLEAMIALAPAVCPKMRGCIRALETAGIHVTACLKGVSYESARILSASGLTDTEPAVRLPAWDGRGSADLIAYTHKGVRAFENCTHDDVADYIGHLQSGGRVVGVLSVDADDLSLLHAADIAITCIPSTERRGETVPPPPDGFEDANRATDLCRRRADVFVRRTTPAGGGVCGVKRALLAARQMRNGLVGAVRYLLISQMLRLLCVLLPVCCGLTLMSAPAVLLSGWVVDLVVVLCYIHADLPSDVGEREQMGQVFKKLHVAFWGDLIAAAVSAVLPWGVVFVATELNVVFGADTAYFAFLSLLLTQMVVLLTGRPPRQGRVTFLAGLLVVCLFAGALAAALGAGMKVIWCLVLPMIQPLTFLTGCLVGRLFGK